METAGRSARSCRGSAGGGAMSLVCAVLRQMMRDARGPVVSILATVAVIAVAVSPTVFLWNTVGDDANQLALIVLNLIAAWALLALIDWILRATRRAMDSLTEEKDDV